MGNKNLILIVCILLLWFLMIRPLTKTKSETETDGGTGGTFKEGTGALTPASTTPNFENGLNRNYTV